MATALMRRVLDDGLTDFYASPQAALRTGFAGVYLARLSTSARGAL